MSEPATTPAPTAAEPQPQPAPADVPDLMESALAGLAGEDGQQGAGPPAGQPAGGRAQAPEKTPGDKPPPGGPQNRPKAATLRAAYNALKDQHRELRSQYEQLLKQQGADDSKLLKKAVEEKEQQLRALQEHLARARYEATPEFQERYEKPFVEVWKQARAYAQTVSFADPELGERPGRSEDFDALLAVPDDKAAAWAQERFGQAASMMLYHRERVLESYRTRHAALEQARQRLEQEEQRRKEEETRHRDRILSLWKSANEDAVKRFPQWFAPKEGDSELNDVLKKGYHLADLAFSDGSGVPPEKMIQIHAAVRHRAAAFGRVVLENQRLAQKVAELEKQLQGYRASEPGASPRPAAGAPPEADVLESVLESLKPSLS